MLSVACGTLDGRTQLGQAEPNAEYGVVARRQGVSTPVRSVETIDHASGRRSPYAALTSYVCSPLADRQRRPLDCRAKTAPAAEDAQPFDRGGTCPLAQRQAGRAQRSLPREHCVRSWRCRLLRRPPSRRKLGATRIARRSRSTRAASPARESYGRHACHRGWEADADWTALQRDPGSDRGRPSPPRGWLRGDMVLVGRSSGVERGCGRSSDGLCPTSRRFIGINRALLRTDGEAPSDGRSHRCVLALDDRGRIRLQRPRVGRCPRPGHGRLDCDRRAANVAN